MARQRKTDVAETETVTQNERNDKMAALSNAEIMALLSKTRQKGVYTERLNEFVESGQAGIEVNSTWPDLGGKKATTLKQGFEAAKEKKEAVEGADKIVVKADKDENGNERVFLINLALVEGVAA